MDVIEIAFVCNMCAEQCLGRSHLLDPAGEFHRSNSYVSKTWTARKRDGEGKDNERCNKTSLSFCSFADCLCSARLSMWPKQPR